MIILVSFALSIKKDAFSYQAHSAAAEPQSPAVTGHAAASWHWLSWQFRVCVVQSQPAAIAHCPVALLTSFTLPTLLSSPSACATRRLLVQFSLHLSRACIGKTQPFSWKMRLKESFPYCCQQGPRVGLAARLAGDRRGVVEL
jgi:hypothetical protein